MTGIERLTLSEGIVCPPAPASCPFTPSVVTVYADLRDGRAMAVMVDLQDDGSLRARPGEAVIRPGEQ